MRELCSTRKQKIKRPSRDLNPRRSLDRAVVPVARSDWGEAFVWWIDKNRTRSDDDVHRLAH